MSVDVCAHGIGLHWYTCNAVSQRPWLIDMTNIWADLHYSLSRHDQTCCLGAPSPTLLAPLPNPALRSALRSVVPLGGVR